LGLNPQLNVKLTDKQMKESKSQHENLFEARFDKKPIKYLVAKDDKNSSLSYKKSSRSLKKAINDVDLEDEMNNEINDNDMNFGDSSDEKINDGDQDDDY
jgi:molybdopterin converting factor small subunit